MCSWDSFPTRIISQEIKTRRYSVSWTKSSAAIEMKRTKDGCEWYSLKLSFVERKFSIWKTIMTEVWIKIIYLLIIYSIINRIHLFHLQGVPDEISNTYKTHVLTKPSLYYCCKADEAQAFHEKPEVARAVRFTAHDVGSLTHYVLKFNRN